MAANSAATYRSSLAPDEIVISEAARAQLGKLCKEVDDEEIEAVRIYVSGGGCSGMSYGMTFTDRKTEYDRVLEAGDFKLYVDAVAMNYLKGLEIDYVERPTGATFVFNNVFASTGGSGTCGRCGAAGGGCGG